MTKNLWARMAAVSAVAVGFVAATSFAQNDVEYSYDELGRLSTVCYAGTSDLITYQYDAAGNRTIVGSEANACGPTSFAIDNATAVTEGTALSFTVNRIGNFSSANTVDYATADGTATAAGSDYTSASGSLTFAIGEASKTITVQTLTDSVYETDETVLVNISNPSSGATIDVAQASGTINNNAGTSGVSFAIANASVSEGGTLSLTVTKTGSTSLTHEVDFATSDGTAAAGSDYTSNSGTLSFGPSETSKTISVSTTGDSVYENNETVFVTISNPTNGATISQSSGVGTINNDDAAPTFAINNKSVNEGGTLSFTVTKTGSTALTHAVNYATANGTAAAGSDYTSTSGTLTFASGDTSKTVSVSTTGDSVYENNETLFVNLSGPTNGATIADSQGQGTINNNDTAPSFAISNASATAGNNLSFTITKSGSTALSHAVHYATANGTASAGTHYTAKWGDLTFTSGQTSKTVSVSTTSGSVPKGSSKTMYVDLSSATSGATIADSRGNGSINGPPNAAPNAVNDSVSGSFELFTTVNVYVLSNDSDPDGDSLTVTSASCTSGGCQVSIQNGTYLKITGTTTGVKYVNYTISDGFGGTDTATATVNKFETGCAFC